MAVDLNALFGGALIGIAASLMLLFNGRVTGISGIVSGLLSFRRGEIAWRFAFLAGLLGGGLALWYFHPAVFAGNLSTELWSVCLAGILVGFGTVLGGGCTSGHGVCGISRLSIRSIVATVVFIVFGVMAVFLSRTLGILP